MSPGFAITAAVVVMLLAPALPIRAAASERPLALDQAVALALSKNEALTIERESLAAARAAVGAAKGAYDPSLALDYGWRKASEPANSSFSGAPAGRLAPETEVAEGNAAIRQLLPTGGRVELRAGGSRSTTDGSLTPLSPAFGAQMGVELRQPLLRDRSIDAARLSVRIATTGRDGANAALRRATVETVAAVERAYWGLGAARRAVLVREQAVQLAQEQLRETQIRTGSGALPRTELAQPQAELERRRGELFAAREAAARAQNTLKLLILSGADDPAWADSLAPAEDLTANPTPVEIGTALERALSARPELAIAEASLRRRRAERAFARDGMWPSLDAVVSYDRFGLAGSQNPAASGAIPAPDGDLHRAFESAGEGDFDATRLGVELGLPLFNRAARGDAAVALHVQRQAEADLARVRKAIRAEVLDAAAALETAGQRIEAARSGRAAAETQLGAERDRFASGLSTNFLVLTRQNDLSRARLDEISANADYLTARTEMARASGTLLEERGIHVENKDR